MDSIPANINTPPIIRSGTNPENRPLHPELAQAVNYGTCTSKDLPSLTLTWSQITDAGRIKWICKTGQTAGSYPSSASFELKYSNGVSAGSLTGTKATFENTGEIVYIVDDLGPAPTDSASSMPTGPETPEDKICRNNGGCTLTLGEARTPEELRAKLSKLLSRER